MLFGYLGEMPNQEADNQYVERGFMARMTEFAGHGRFLQVEGKVNSLPVDGEVVCGDVV
jgi:hypothetical protein